MDSRTKKSHSLALDTKTSTQKRPELGDRHNSAPSSNRQSKRASASTKASESSRRSSKASARDDVESRPSATNRAAGRPNSGQQSSQRLSQQRNDSDDITTFSFVVLGGRGVGKSGFIRNALDLRKSPTTAFATSKVSLAGSLYRVQLLELLFDDVDFGNGDKVTWPKYLNSVTFPAVEGAFCLYDVADQDSVAYVPQALSTLSNSGVPCTLVACKTDIPESQHEVSSRFREQVQRSFKAVVISETSKDEPESQKRCLLSILNRVLANSRESSNPPSRNQSESRVRQPARQSSSRDTSPEKSRSRSRSQSRLRVSRSKDLLLNITNRPPVIESGDEDTESDSDEDVEPPPPLKTRLRVDTENIIRPPARPAAPQTPESSGDLRNSRLITPSEPGKPAIPETPESYYIKSMLRPGTADTADSRAFQTFLNMDDESHDDSPEQEAEPVPLAISKLNAGDTTRQDSGLSFKELVERLLLLPASKQDSKFVPSFLCLYRCFATPQRLIAAIIEQFVETEKSDLVHFTKVAEQLRYLQVLGQWTAQYPGDFAGAPARDIATAFVQSLEKSKNFAPAAREISNNLDTYTADDDLDWAYDDCATPGTSKESLAMNPNQTISSTSMSNLLNDGTSKQAASRGRRHEYDGSDEDNEGTGSSTRGSGAPSNASSMLRTGNSSQSHQNLQQLEHARDQARKFRPNPHVRLTKIQWHQFMETPIDELAREITRIDWSMYSAIRPRDFVRHVTLSEHKRRLRKTDNISMMVRQFNHLALFVSGMILLRDKPKHRAKVLEKFMALAWKVRQLNNYNSLGAIVAGITGHEIARLGVTRDLVPPEVQKQFLRLTILMGISRSYAAYRMAWDNSFQERMPFVPLLRQDLTMAASANPTYIGKNINWKKFEVMGDVIVGIQKSLEAPYSFPSRTMRIDEIIKLVLESRILDEPEDSADPRSELYERSVQIEPQPGADSRKKLDWLRR